MHRVLWRHSWYQIRKFVSLFDLLSWHGKKEEWVGWGTLEHHYWDTSTHTLTICVALCRSKDPVRFKYATKKWWLLWHRITHVPFSMTATKVFTMLIWYLWLKGHDYFVWNIEWELIPEVDVLPSPKNICRNKRQVLVTQQNQYEEKDTSRMCANRIAVTQFSSSCVRSLCNKKSCVLLTAQLLSLSFPIYVSHTG